MEFVILWDVQENVLKSHLGAAPVLWLSVCLRPELQANIGKEIEQCPGPGEFRLDFSQVTTALLSPCL